MKNIFLFTLIFSTIIVAASHADDRIDRKKSIITMRENDKINKPSSFYKGPGLILEGSNSDNGAIIIGPERQTGLSGFYDWQTNGECKHHVYYVNSSTIHTALMTAFDSLDTYSSRRTVYTISTDGGVSWMIPSIQVPNVRSGFAFLTAGNTGSSNEVAIIANHYETPLRSYVHVDAFPGLGSFTSYQASSPRYFIWPQANTMDNGNLLVTGNIYENSTAIDTIVMSIFNPNSGNWVGIPQYFRAPATDHYFTRWTSAAGPGGRGLIVISPVNETGGAYFGSRIFYWTTTDHGTSWSGPGILYDTQIDPDGDTSRPWASLDAVYDAYGNFYVAFNTTSLDYSYSSAKIWINRNGTQNKIIAKNSTIPGALQNTSTLQSGMCSMDWVSVSVTDNGHFVLCAYSVAKQNDIVNGFNSMDIYLSYMDAGLGGPSQPNQITSGINDERYVSLNRKTLNNYFLPIVYQKDPQPGSSSFNDGAPLSRAELIYRELSFLNPLSNTGISGINNPDRFILYQNYPNPFNPSTNIKFDIPRSGNVKISIYDNTGRLIERLVEQNLSPGTYEAQWGGSACASGVYFCRLETENFLQTQKMLLIR